MSRKACSSDQKKSIICLRDTGMFQHQISRQLNISCKCIRQTIYKFDKFHTIATKPGAGRTPKVTERQKRLNFNKFRTIHYHWPTPFVFLVLI